MAPATTDPSNTLDPFDLGAYTPANLARGARAALLRNSSAIENSPIGAPPRRFARATHTPSSPLVPIPFTVAGEGAQQGNRLTTPEIPSLAIAEPISVVEQANRLELEQVKAYEAKVAVFRACVNSFEETLKQFTSGPERHFAEHFTNSFIEFWSEALRDVKSAPYPTVPTYSSIAANNAAHRLSPRPLPTDPNLTLPPVLPQQHGRQGQRPRPAPPKEDLRVFIRLPSDAPARHLNGFSIRDHITKKIGIDLRKIPQVTQTKTGWAILPTDHATHALLIERQSEWSEELGATAIEKGQKWFTYIVPECPRRLTDLQGKELDYINAAKEDILCQTGLSPVRVQPTRKDSGDPFTQTITVSFLEQPNKPWRLFGSSQPARLLEKHNPPNQCKTCWGYHPRRDCRRTVRCRRCGLTGHLEEKCTAQEQCANCLGPHVADTPTCPARPKRTHGMLRRLTKEERSLVRRLGQQMYHHQNRIQTELPRVTEQTPPETLAETSTRAANMQTEHLPPAVTTQGTKTATTTESAQTQAASQRNHGEERETEGFPERISTPALSPAASFIMVASEHSADDELDTTQALPKKRRRRATIASP